MKRFYLSGHNNFGNRGCEALVRATVAMLEARYGSVEVFVPSTHPELDRRQWPEANQFGVRFVEDVKPSPAYRAWGRLCNAIPPVRSVRWPELSVSRETMKAMDQVDAVLSIGGDNYSLDYGLVSLFLHMGVAGYAMRRGIPVALWGVSAGPFDREPRLAPQIRDHLQRMRLITVRESFTGNYLRQLGVGNNVVAVADPAFALGAEAVDLDGCMPERASGGVIGLNVSPLLQRYRAATEPPEVLVQEVADFLRDAVRDLGVAFLLIPHVVPLDGNPLNNDAVYMQQLIDRTAGLGGYVRMASPCYNAAQLKFVMSQCRFFIGARTHATIGALSMRVPTISIAYSVKAKGINQDLFAHTRYVLNTPEVGRQSLMRAVRTLVAEEDAIRARLEQAIPEWKARAHAGVDALRSRLEPGLGVERSADADKRTSVAHPG